MSVRDFFDRDEDNIVLFSRAIHFTTAGALFVLLAGAVIWFIG